MTSCYEGPLYVLSDTSSFTLSDPISQEVVVGRLETCFQGDYVPVCASALSYEELNRLCDENMMGSGQSCTVIVVFKL